MSSLMSFFFLFKCLYFLFHLFLREGALSFSRFLNINNTESKYLFLSTFCIVMFRENDLSQHIEHHFVWGSAYCSSAGVIVSCWSPTFTYLMIIIQFSLDPFLDEEGVRYVPVRPRPPITLLRHYRNPWKAAYHHFQRYSDVRVKGQSASCSLPVSFVRDEPLQRTC